MVAVALVVSIVIVTGILQGQANEFGDFSEEQTSNSDCSVTVNQLRAYCPDSGSSWSNPSASSIVSSSSCSGLEPSNVC